MAYYLGGWRGLVEGRADSIRGPVQEDGGHLLRPGLGDVRRQAAPQLVTALLPVSPLAVHLSTRLLERTQDPTSVRTARSPAKKK